MTITLAIITALVPIALSILRFLYGTDTTQVTKVIEVDGSPIGPKLAARLRSLSMALALLLLSGCNAAIGPKTEDHIIFIRHDGVAARAAENKKVLAIVEKDGKVYRQYIDVGGFYLISPDLKTDADPLTKPEIEKLKKWMGEK